MKTAKQKAFVTILLAALCLHFILVFLYASPFHSPRLYNYSRIYTYPFFHQSWSLFVPVPTEDYSLFVNCKGKKSELIGDLLNESRENRFGPAEPLLMALTKSIHYFEKNTSGREKLNGPVKDDQNFKMLLQSTGNFLINRGMDTAGIKIIVLVSDVRSHESRAYFN